MKTKYVKAFSIRAGDYIVLVDNQAAKVISVNKYHVKSIHRWKVWFGIEVEGNSTINHTKDFDSHDEVLKVMHKNEAEDTNNERRDATKILELDEEGTPRRL